MGFKAAEILRQTRVVSVIQQRREHAVPLYWLYPGGREVWRRSFSSAIAPENFSRPGRLLSGAAIADRKKLPG
jgi:hypothetical protein